MENEKRKTLKKIQIWQCMKSISMSTSELLSYDGEFMHLPQLALNFYVALWDRYFWQVEQFL